MATKWTHEQIKAIETRGANILVSAAAGAGKTAVLVERILRKITDQKSDRHQSSAYRYLYQCGGIGNERAGKEPLV